jgi:hypothetical protein
MSSRNRDIARILGKTEAANPNNTSLKATGGSTAIAVYSSLDSLPTTSLTAGDQAYVSANSRLYVSNGSGWYNVAIVNATPTLSLSSTGTIALASDGSTTTVIRLTGTDSDNADANLVYSIESGGDFFKLATIVQDSAKQYTITPRTEAAATALGFDGSATLTFKASDGINQATVQNTFTLTFEADWSNGFSLVTNFDETSASVNAQFGSYTMDVTPDGTRLMVCAREDDQTGTTNNIGSVYIYTTTDNWANWTLEQKIQQAGTSYNNLPHIYHGAQGAAISDDGNWLVVGASRYGSNLHGRVYLWERSGTSWSAHSNFGSPVGMNYYFGDGAFDFSADASVMAIGHHSNSTNNKGQVYFYTRSGSTWTYRGVEYGRSVQNQRGYFGQGVRVSEDGNWVFVGEYNYWNGSVQAGRIHAYLRSGNSWSYSHSISTGNTQYETGKNFSLNSDATRIAIGAPDYTDGNDTNSPGNYKGAILIYTRTDANATSWTQRAILRNQDLYQYGAQSQGQMGNNGMEMTRDGLFIAAGNSTAYVVESGSNVNKYGGLDIWKDTSSGSDGTAWTKQASIKGADLSLTKGMSHAIAFTSDATRVFSTIGDNAQLGSVARNYVKVFKPA